MLNQGVLPANGFQLSYVLNGGTRFQNVFNQTIDAGESINVSLPELALTAGTNELEVVVKQLGGGNDEFPENDTLVHPFDVQESDYWTLNLTTGFFASETSWTLVDESGDVVWSENDYSAGINDYIYEGCMTTGCYTLTFFDAGGDGMKFGGSMVLTNGAGDVIAEITEEENEFGSEISFEICATVAETAGCIDANGNGMCDDAEIAGCLDIDACNFNSQAIMDGGNCTYPEGLLDCEGNCIDDADGDGICDNGSRKDARTPTPATTTLRRHGRRQQLRIPNAETYLNCAGCPTCNDSGDRRGQLRVRTRPLRATTAFATKLEVAARHGCVQLRQRHRRGNLHLCVRTLRLCQLHRRRRRRRRVRPAARYCTRPAGNGRRRVVHLLPGRVHGF